MTSPSDAPRPALGELARNRIRTTLGLFASAIKSGESWDAELDAALADAFEAVAQLVALATGGAEGGQGQDQLHSGSTMKAATASPNQPQEPTPKGEGTMPTDKTHRGLYAKFTVTRTDGTDAPGGKHDGCDYFTLDLTHDEFAAPALIAYADACRAKYPALARDLRQEADAIRLRGCTGLFPSPGRGAV